MGSNPTYKADYFYNNTTHLQEENSFAYILQTQQVFTKITRDFTKRGLKSTNFFKSFAVAERQSEVMTRSPQLYISKQFLYT